VALPDFFIAGVPKAGTTALHVALGRHPALYMSAVKEPKFFLRAGSAVTAALPGHAGSGVTDHLERILQQDAAPRRPLTWQERQQLIPRFEADIRLLESVTGEDFSDWLGPRGDTGGLVGARPSEQRQARNGLPRSP
jgi:hypothetical protein